MERGIQQFWAQLFFFFDSLLPKWSCNCDISQKIGTQWWWWWWYCGITWKVSSMHTWASTVHYVMEEAHFLLLTLSFGLYFRLSFREWQSAFLFLHRSKVTRVDCVTRNLRHWKFYANELFAEWLNLDPWRRFWLQDFSQISDIFKVCDWFFGSF